MSMVLIIKLIVRQVHGNQHDRSRQLPAAIKPNAVADAAAATALTIAAAAAAATALTIAAAQPATAAAQPGAGWMLLRQLRMLKHLWGGLPKCSLQLGRSCKLETSWKLGDL